MWRRPTGVAVLAAELGALLLAAPRPRQVQVELAGRARMATMIATDLSDPS